MSHSPSKANQPLNNLQKAGQPLHVNMFPVIVVLLSILLTVSFIVLILSSLIGLQLGNSLLHPVPVCPYEAAVQSIESLAAYARQTTQGHLLCLTDASPHRTNTASDGPVAVPLQQHTQSSHKMRGLSEGRDFGVIGLTIRDDRIQQLEFYPDVLPEDVLLFYWGMPIPSANPAILSSWNCLGIEGRIRRLCPW